MASAGSCSARSSIAPVPRITTLIAGIEATNLASKALHLEFGFEPCGVIRHAGYKFGRWLDLEFHQLVFESPNRPVEG